MSRYPRTQTMAPFNNANVLRVVQLDDGRMGVIDDSKRRIWIEFDIQSSAMQASLQTVTLPDIPHGYGKWVATTIGGVSRTIRRVNCVRVKAGADPVTVFATQIPEHFVDVLVKSLTDSGVHHAVGDVEQTDEFGTVMEIVIFESENVHVICAILARHGSTAMFEENVTRRDIAIERMDRIEASCVSAHTSLRPSDDTFGARRGTENWRFEWIPDHWTRVPLTWDHMVANMCDVDINDIPQPLRQHVAYRRICDGDHDLMGTRWVLSETQPTVSELSPCGDSAALRRCVLDVPNLGEALDRGDTITQQELTDWNVPIIDSTRFLVRGPSSSNWYRPRDTIRPLSMHIPTRRLVSAALTAAQSRQLITAFYLVSVECVRDEVVFRAARLILYRYMLERGYTARWLGKYVQEANFIGNGVAFRQFRRLSQYSPDRLPTHVLNRICLHSGQMANRGSKGSRSKYCTDGRYVPKRRLTRTERDEDEMRKGHD